MTTSNASFTNDPQPPMALSDLFAPMAGQAAGAGHVALDVPPALAKGLQRLAASHDWLLDTPWLGAWLGLQAQWTGSTVVTWLEASEADPRARRLTCVLGGAGAAVEAMVQLDALRRTSDSVEVAQPGASELFCGWAGGRSGGATPPTGLIVGVRAGERPSLWMDFDTALVDASLAQGLLAVLLRAAQALLDDPVRRLDTLPTVVEDERRRQREGWGSPISHHILEQTVHGRFAEQVAARGEAPAVVWRQQRLSYRELDRLADSCRQHLQRAGVSPGELVCVALERSPQAVAMLLGILRAGAAYLPLDSSYPAERLAYMLEDASVRVVVTTSDRRAAFPQARTVVLVDQLDQLPASAPVTERPTGDGESLAYVMYTSGSTGLPKGIEICHRSILRLVIDPSYVDLSPRQAFLHAAPLGFDASTLEIWGPLLNGGCCVLHDEDLPTPAGLARTIRDQGVTTAWLTAALFNAVVDDDPEHLRGLEQLLIGGEALSVAHVRRALAALPMLTLINGYGPTECTTFTTTYRIPHALPADLRSIPIGRPINATSVQVLSPTQRLLPVGMVGELYVAGQGLARGYLQRPELTAERFVVDPVDPSLRLYRTGDLVRWLPEGQLEFIGRADGQVKIRGFRIELGEIEAALASHPGIKACAVVPQGDVSGSARLVAYLVPTDGEVPANELRAHLAERLPDFMQPAAQVWLATLPLTTNGKLDRRALPQPPSQRPDLTVPYQQAQGEVERKVCAAFAEVLGLDRVGRADNFFELGGNSLLVLRVLARLDRDGYPRLSTNAFFRQPTPQSVALELSAGAAASTLEARRLSRHGGERAGPANEPIAIVGMAGRFPGARDIEQFWINLCEGRDTITRFTDQQLDPSLSASLTGDACYVKARGIVEDVEWFDAAFFGISPREAELMDPQQRLFLEICWECLERAGYAPDACAMPVGVFAGMYNATYFQRHVQHRPDLIDKLGEFQVMLANEKDYITTRVAHKLNLTGPAVSVHTACSTSLVAIAQALASLRAGQCDMALAGGSSITCPPNSGYLYQEGAMLSPDGMTRSFDAQAQGTVFSDGVAVVLLKRLNDALADGDTVHAVIRGAAVNNDGRDKASFTAPSVDGQAAVIAAAHEAAGIDPRSLSYIETHGTATPLGDPVEVEGLTRAFRRRTADVGFCRIGSVKSNMGHLVIAAGATGVIKTALALASEQLPPSIHYDTPNPKIDFAGSPFVVNDRLTAWPRGEHPRRAGVSSFGVGGTNAHVVLEEAPLLSPTPPADGPQLLLLSARSRSALDAMATRLADHLAAPPAQNLADIAHTLQVGRSRYAHRLCVVAGDAGSAVAALRANDDPMRALRQTGAATPSLVWVFPGQGAQYAGMGRGLYQRDAVFRAAFDACCAALDGVLPFDLRSRMFDGDADALVATATTQPATFCLEYALAQCWLARGAEPVALIGHSVGEFAAAVLAGVMSLDDAARLVARRGALMQMLPAGSMMTVRLPAGQLQPRLPETLSLAAENGPTACVVAGPSAAIEAWRAQLETEGVAVRLLQTSHAFHSSMMEPAVAPFEAAVRAISLSVPQRPIVSTLTGALLTAEQATDPRYWARHLREPVRFSPAVQAALAAYPDAAFVEIGPRASLSTLVRQHKRAGGGVPLAVASLADQPDSEPAQLLLAQGHLWTAGIELPASAATPAEGRRRVRLPTYAFERKRFWLDAPAPGGPAASAAAAAVSVIAAAQATHPTAASTPDVTAAMVPNSVSSLTPSPNAMSNAPFSASRRPHIVGRLRTLFEDVAGTELGDADPTMSFVELGLDSLTLTQAALQVKKQFSVPLTFRQLMEKYRSFDSLAEFVDASLPPDAAPAATPTEAMAPNAGVATPVVSAVLPMPMNSPVASQPLLQQVIQQQMQLMAQQLALLSGAVAGVAAIPASSPPVVATAAATPVLPQSVAPAPAPAALADDAGTVRYDVKKAFGAIARIHTQANELTDRQQARLQAFVRRYVERTRKSKDYTVAHRSHLADPRVVNGFRPMTKEIVYQIVVERSKGSRMWDLDGNEYVDVLNGFGMNLFGWQPDFVQQAVKRQLDAGYEIGPQHPLAGEVAQLVCELTGFDRAGLCNTGSEAVMAAVRIARTVTGRNTVVLFTGSYHGTFDEVVVRAGRGGKGIPAAPGILSGVFGDVRVLDYGTPESLEFIRSHADDLAAVLVEPVQSRRPDFQPKEFLKEVRAITEKSGTCLIFDEVITGFRSNLGGAQAHYGIRADLASYGKVIGGGFPVGVIAGKREYMDALDGGPWQFGDDSMPTVGVTYFAGTFVRHPLALAAAKASLEHLKQQGNALQTQLNLHTAAMADELTAFCREVGAPIEIRYFASLWRVSWLEDHPLQDLLFAMMRSRGVHILDNFPCFMTTAHTPQDIATIKSAFKESVAELQEAEFLPRRVADPAVLADASKPPVPNAKLGRDKDGKPTWFVPDPAAPGKYKKINA